VNFTIVNAAQRSDAWKAARLGRLTGSRAADMLSTGRSGAEAAGRRNLRVQLVLERVTGKPQERSFQSAAMQHGIETEDEACATYEALTGTLLERTGFLSHNTLMVGCSLDSHVGDFEGIVEIKCPIPATHWEYLQTGKVPGDYLKQVTHGLWVSGAQWCDWMSYEPSFPETLRAKIVRVPRDEAAIDAYQRAALTFLSEVAIECDKVAVMAAGAPPVGTM